MNVYTNNQFTGFYPVGNAAVVTARTKIGAARMLNRELVKRGLKPTAEAKQFVRLDNSAKHTRILCDGNY